MVTMNITLEHVRFESILCKLDDYVVRKEGHNPLLDELTGIISEESARMLLYLHPMLVSPLPGNGGTKQMYQFLSGLQSYLLARSVVDGREVPVLVVDKVPVPNPQMINQLLSRPLLLVSDEQLLKQWDYWREVNPDQLADIGTRMKLKQTEAKLIGLTESRVRAVRRNANPSWKKSGGSNGAKPLSQSSLLDEEDGDETGD
jgi:hypothetical protein